jgi:hypothetical protein
MGSNWNYQREFADNHSHQTSYWDAEKSRNSIIIDDNSPEYKRRMLNMTSFPLSTMIKVPSLTAIEESFQEFADDDKQLRSFGKSTTRLKFCRSYCLMNQQSQLGNQLLLIPMMQVAMKNELELAIATIELADNKITKTSDQNMHRHA